MEVTLSPHLRTIAKSQLTANISNHNVCIITASLTPHQIQTTMSTRHTGTAHSINVIQAKQEGIAHDQTEARKVRTTPYTITTMR